MPIGKLESSLSEIRVIQVRIWMLTCTARDASDLAHGANHTDRKQSFQLALLLMNFPRRHRCLHETRTTRFVFHAKRLSGAVTFVEIPFT